MSSLLIKKKYNFILFTTRQIKVDIKITVENFELEIVKQAKFLEVIINEQLTWHDAYFTYV